MKISLGSDHAGYRLKTAIAAFLRAQSHVVLDRGTDSDASVDYPDFAHAVATDVATGAARFGVLVCSSGIGISIAANKVQDIRAAVCTNEDIAEFSRRHNDANVICFGQKYVTEDMAKKYLALFLTTPFEGGRHERRVKKIEPTGE
ncbi:MAG: ribose 5-phosphate isomerase B [Puniceicoccales bacterium]|jgi:ribose 5-phosphate isomerase B|nr:ribose 5-phosphate isomerase B [Puniceicoccales bacterium]